MRDFFWRVGQWLVRAWEGARDGLRRALPNDRDTPEVRSLKLTVFLFVGIIGLMVLIGALTFALAVRGQEQTLVPNVTGKDLVTALVEMQEKELYPRVQVQFSSETAKNIVMAQSPAPGTLVKAGRRITLRVSKGPVLQEVEDYVGRNLDEVRSYLQTLYASHSPNLVIGEPVYRTEKGAAPGTILAQSPEPGTQITGLTTLSFVVARGEGELATMVGEYVGMSFSEAMAQLVKDDLPFFFSVKKAAAGQAAGVVVSQEPEPGSRISLGNAVQLVMTPPEKPGKGKIFGLFRYLLPDYPILVDIRLDVIADTGRLTILSARHAGGPLAVPYIVPEGADLVLTVLDKEEVSVQASSYQF
jgi:eukaryotic-like serine/threonine-protein kinase